MDNQRKWIRGKNVVYKFFWGFSNKETFDIWSEQFKSSKKWQKKYIQKDKNGKEFIWYIHNSRRFKKPCEYSNSENCKARMKVPTSPDREGRYILEFNEDGNEHFLSEFYPKFRKLVLNKEVFIRVEDPNLISTQNMSQKENKKDEQKELEAFKIDDVSNPDPTSNIQPKIVDEIEAWEQLANRITEVVKISPDRTLIKSELQPLPSTVIHISRNNGPIDWKVLEAENKQLRMVFARCSRGVTRDSEFLNNFPAMVALRLPQLGVYHLFLGGLDSPTAEEQFEVVNQVLNEARFNKKKDLFAVVVQTENNTNFSSLYFTAQLIKFISLLRKANFMRPIINCNNNSWNNLIVHSDGNAEELFSKLPLWIAHFTENKTPTYPETWKSRGIPWWMWSYTSSGAISGINNLVCFNRRNESYSVHDNYFYSNI